MRDGDFQRVKRVRSCLAAALLVACGKAAPPPPPPTQTPATPVVAAPPSNACPADGRWAKCSIMYRLERAGLAPKVDSGATPREAIGGDPMMLKIGLSATLELHVFPDSVTRLAGGAKLDRSQLVSGTAEQTIKRERTLIESANVIGLLTSINGHQRERVSDALTAGPPQPATP